MFQNWRHQLSSAVDILRFQLNCPNELRLLFLILTTTLPCHGDQKGIMRIRPTLE
jgi:hypothetical protein